MIKPSVSPDAGSEVRFQAYINALSEEIGHADRIDLLRRYCTGLLLPGERKSIEPMAARLDPRHVQATHQSLHHFVAKAPWSDAAVLKAVREQVLPALTRHGPITAWILDDTSFPKKGTHSVGVARQYCGQLGKQDNCQVAVSLSLANDGGSLPVAFDLYLPEEWLLIEWPADDQEPSQYWLSTLPATTALVDLVHRAKLRWRIERDYQDLKQELGLDHYEGRGWRGFHHHATLCIAAYGFLVRERSLFPPDEHFRRPAPALPPGWRPRGHSGAAGTP